MKVEIFNAKEGEEKSLIAKTSVVVTTEYADFDGACRLAKRRAADEFHVDEYGHSDIIPQWSRTDSWVEVKFDTVVIKRLDSFRYMFTAYAYKNCEEY